MRFATYNVEWFNGLFDGNGEMLDDNAWSARHDVTRAQQLGAIGTVMRAIDADALMVIEAPDGSRKRSTVRALENFAGRYRLRARKALVGFPNDTEQEIALLYDPDVMSARHAPGGSPGGPEGTAKPGRGRRLSARFDRQFRWDLDVDRAPETVRFSKPPLEARVRLKSGARLRLIGVHVKSKAPYGAHDAQEVMRISIENRRKQLAQAIWLRSRVEEFLSAGDSLMVMGDFNDGPGLDEYEKLFGRSSVEIVLGEDGEDRLFDPHARQALSRRLGAAVTTSRFYLAREQRYMEALLDYIMVSEDLMKTRPHWRIWHPFDDPQCLATPDLQQALLRASDHFPVTIDLAL